MIFLVRNPLCCLLSSQMCPLQRLLTTFRTISQHQRNEHTCEHLHKMVAYCVAMVASSEQPCHCTHWQRGEAYCPPMAATQYKTLGRTWQASVLELMNPWQASVLELMNLWQASVLDLMKALGIGVTQALLTRCNCSESLLDRPIFAPQLHQTHLQHA